MPYKDAWADLKLVQTLKIHFRNRQKTFHGFLIPALQGLLDLNKTNNIMVLKGEDEKLWGINCVTDSLGNLFYHCIVYMILV